MKKKVLIFSLVLTLALISGFFYLLHLMFVGFEHRDAHNGVGWTQFSRSLKKEIKAAGFQASDFGHYEGAVWFGTLVNEQQSITLGMFTRSNYEDPRDLNTLKRGIIYNIGDKSISCFDDFEHKQTATISVLNMKLGNVEKPVSSITDILDNYADIDDVVANFANHTYLADNGEIIDLPKWLHVNVEHNNCRGENHVIQHLSCKLESSD